jgi:3-oxoadipate CoA-transferase, beta subunit
MRSVYTDDATFDIAPDVGVRVRETFGIGIAELACRSTIEIREDKA